MRAQYYIAGTTADTVFIVDHGVDVMSVTNDAEAVVAHVFARHGNKRIIYRDSDNRWDELLHENGLFKDFAPFSGTPSFTMHQT